MNKTENNPVVGPIAYENWKSALSGWHRRSTLEYPLFTDARIIGEVVEGYGPYQLFNAVPWPDIQTLFPSVFLRVDYYLEYVPKVELETDVQRYHGGSLQDEIAALLSLCLGIKLKAGEFTYLYEPDKDPKGRPVSWQAHKNPVLFKPSGQLPILPATLGEHNLQGASPLSTLPALVAQDCIALVRAARLYQDALWISDSAPEQSWLMLVSAVETAANHWHSKRESPVERLRAFRPELDVLLREAGGNTLVEQVAAQIADFMGSTQKFTDFLLRFMPNAPTNRPASLAQQPWDEDTLRKSLKKIYNWRSRALHGGIPFPEPMCDAPVEFHGGLIERPLGIATSSKGGVWATDDAPMLLHVFEYIVRNSLLKWWQSML